MFDIECPKCKMSIGPDFIGFFQQRIEKRECPNCGAELELCNAALFFVFNGLVFSGLLMLLGYWGFQKQWVKVIILIIVGSLCLVIGPVLAGVIGQWRVCSYGVKDAGKAGRWARAGSVSSWIFGSAVAWTAIRFAAHYRDFVLRADDFVGGGGDEALESLWFGLRFHVYPGIVVALAALAVSVVAWLMRRRLRCIDDEEIYG